MPQQPCSHSSSFRSISTFIFRGLSLIGGLGLISSGFVLAEIAEIEVESQSDLAVPSAAELLQPVAPAVSTPAPMSPPAAIAPPEPAPAAPLFSPSQLTEQPEVSTQPAAQLEALIQSAKRSEIPTQLIEQVEASISVDAAPLETVEAPVEPSSIIAPTAPSVIAPSSPPAGENAPAGYNGFNTVFIDSTDYSVGATQNPNIPSIVLSERTTGCQITLERGDLVPANVCNSPFVAGQAAIANFPTAGNASINLGPISIGSNGFSVGGATTTASREYYNRMVQPLNTARQGEQQFVFPLSIPAPITSLFGWRMHPIHNAHRFHTGTDLGAPVGTPVLAAQAGQVAFSNFLGGYGLAVILRHDDGVTESLYGHLSQLLVQPGEQVEPGEVIGLVGSTGNSTGPHLHFEVRQLTADGWIALNTNNVLQYALAQLIQALDNPLASSAVDPKAEKADFQLPFRPAQPNAS